MCATGAASHPVAMPRRHTHTGRRTADPIRVLIVDDHPAVARGVQRLVCDQPDMEVVAVSHDATSAGRLAACDVAVVDYHLSGPDGLWLTLDLKRRPVPPAVLLYSAFSDDVLTVAAAVAGADGVLRKSAVGSELCLAIRHLAAGETYLPRVPPIVLSALATRAAREHRTTFTLLAEGRPADAVAAQLGVSVSRVEGVREDAVRALSPPATRTRMPLSPVRRLRTSGRPR
jgi:DNA-binding NarL/FixJ family response regulator